MIGKIEYKYLFAVLMLGGTLGCNSQKFRRSDPEIKVGTRELSYQCTGQTSTGSETLSGPKGTSVIIRGQFCTKDLTPKKTEALHVVLVNDFSGSMGMAAKGADPRRSDGGCGRLDAAKAITSRLQSMLATAGPDKVAPDIKVASVVFGSTARVAEPFKDLQSFVTTSITPENFCGADMAGTNYQAAFDTTASQLNSVMGPKIIYFISDGAPTTYGSGLRSETNPDIAKSAGSDSANKLKAIEGVELNIVYLKDPESSQDPSIYLNSLINNDPNRLKFAQNASDLVTQVKLIELPRPNMLSDVGASGILESPQDGSRNFSVKILPLDQERGIWSFETEAIPLNGRAGEAIDYRAIIRVNTDAGEALQSIITLKFNRS
jgi:hypothetical protein